ncbi:hypothetical protein EDC19_0962 [Natranaerovirga hydrolytica]|uniref:ATPase AAA-type core domain-containing protein n=1 Tax=Natranaerovirga hydrolytica TaxID=680378 RepID=A0A4R1N799_9FIRM|nr:AAA family ATPase [Natranaerovirga hydrolytica]TCK98533.1 hypothetical protein EDC19_0962 [Natranaerovirga hydrolytica]
MFSYVKLKNYKSLVNTVADFRNKKKKPKKLVLVYGENGSGKSNLVSSFYTLDETLRTMEIKDKLAAISNGFNEDDKKDVFLELLKHRYRDLQTIIQKDKTINSKGNMVLEFGIDINGRNGHYLIETDESKVIKEELYFTIEKNKGFHLKLSYDSFKINDRIFIDQAYNNELKDKFYKFWGKHTFLSILCNELEEKNEDYIESRLSHNILEVIYFLKSFSVNIKEGNRGERGKYGISHHILSKLKTGNIAIEEEKQLDNIENFLREFLTSLYADIKDVYYVKTSSEDKIKYQLYCKKMIGDELKDINFDLESTGTLRLIDFIPALLMSLMGNTTIIDEFDSGIHDLLVKNILVGMHEAIKGQLIITTHNTLLMEESISRDALYFIVINSDGHKEILCLNDYEHRTHPNNNIRDLYLKGLYEGIPIMLDLDFEEWIDELEL